MGNRGNVEYLKGNHQFVGDSTFTALEMLVRLIRFPYGRMIDSGEVDDIHRTWRTECKLYITAFFQLSRLLQFPKLGGDLEKTRTRKGVGWGYCKPISLI